MVSPNTTNRITNSLTVVLEVMNPLTQQNPIQGFAAAHKTSIMQNNKQLGCESDRFA